MGKLRDQMKMDMKFWRFSPKTISCYLACMRDIARYFSKSPAELREEEVRRHLHHLIEERKASQSVISPAFQSASAVMDYLGRYTHRVAISNYPPLSPPYPARWVCSPCGISRREPYSTG